MKIMIGVGHPKQVHFWKNIVKKLTEHGHEIKVLASNKDVSLSLLDTYGFDYQICRMYQKNIISKVFGIFNRTFQALSTAMWFKPDIFIAGTPHLAYVSKILGKKHIMITDTEHANFTYALTYLFTDVICTPSCFKRKINPKKHKTVNGYLESAYLHFNYFKPDPCVLKEVGLNENDDFIILRFVSWNATHDINQTGISNEMKNKYISELKRYGRVFISSENDLEKEFEKYKLKIAPEKFHSLLSYAKLYMGEGGSMGTEAAILGTPSIHISTTAQFCGNFNELHDKYGLIHTFADDYQALEKAIQILNDSNSKQKWMKKRDNMMKEKTDVTMFMTEFIENCLIDAEG